jgi:hypothetical protein
MLPNILGKKSCKDFYKKNLKMPNPSTIDKLKRQFQVGKWENIYKVSFIKFDKVSQNYKGTIILFLWLARHKWDNGFVKMWPCHLH